MEQRAFSGGKGLESLRALAGICGFEPSVVPEQPHRISSVPGTFTSNDLLSFCQAARVTSLPAPREQSVHSGEFAELNDIANLVFGHSREPKCSNETGYEERVGKLLRELLPNVQIKLGNLFDVQLEVAPTFALPLLPAPYGFKGGAARFALRSALGLPNFVAPRDLDLVRLGASDELTDLHMSKTYMPDDFAYNGKNGVEVINGVRSYLRTRDLSLNEVLLLGNRLHLTLQCLLDSITEVVRPAASHYKHHGAGMRGSVAAKALRFLAQRTAHGLQSEIVYFAINRDEQLRAFDVGLNLRRSCAQSPSAARLFLAAIAMTNSMPELPWSAPAPDVLAFLERQARLPANFLEGIQF